MESKLQESEHRIYTGRMHRGNQLRDYGKCRCGAVLQGREAIDEHRAEYERSLGSQ